MSKQSHTLIYITVMILLALIACGSICDFEIANEIYIGEMPSENMFGMIFSFIGIIPTFVGWSFLGASIFYLSKKQIEDTKKDAGIRYSLLFFLCFRSSIFAILYI